jgi:hypothetical protein
MSREKLLWSLVLLFGLIGLVGNSVVTGSGQVHVQPEAQGFARHPAAEGKWQKLEPVYGPDRRVTEWNRPDGTAVQPEIAWTRFVRVPTPKEQAPAPGVRFSFAGTLRIWIAAALTLCALSFLWGDNVFFRVMQALIVGVSAGYVFVVYVWGTLVPNLFASLAPRLMQGVTPGLVDKEADWTKLVPLVLGIMLLCRLLPRGKWIARWPLAFFIGLLAGVNLVNIFRADFVEQVRSTIVPLIVVAENRVDWVQSFRNMATVISVLASLTYFFFSVEHHGPVGVAARVGIGVLMITFGASFGLTVMTRITIFSGRLQFLFQEWLGLIQSG